jgi:hypothetical protein
MTLIKVENVSRERISVINLNHYKMIDMLVALIKNDNVSKDYLSISNQVFYLRLFTNVEKHYNYSQAHLH